MAFPEPESVAEEVDGVRLLNLAALIELKLASGMSSLDRLKDLADVQELIKMLRLPEELIDQLDPYVQARYRELWTGVDTARRRREAGEEPEQG